VIIFRVIIFPYNYLSLRLVLHVIFWRYDFLTYQVNNFHVITRRDAISYRRIAQLTENLFRFVGGCFGRNQQTEVPDSSLEGGRSTR